MVPRRRRRIFYPGLDSFGENGVETIPEEILNAMLPDDELSEDELKDGEDDRVATGRWIPDSENQCYRSSKNLGGHKRSKYDE